jgi:hypothetical protein
MSKLEFRTVANQSVPLKTHFITAISINNLIFSVIGNGFEAGQEQSFNQVVQEFVKDLSHFPEADIHRFYEGCINDERHEPKNQEVWEELSLIARKSCLTIMGYSLEIGLILTSEPKIRVVEPEPQFQKLSSDEVIDKSRKSANKSKEDKAVAQEVVRLGQAYLDSFVSDIGRIGVIEIKPDYPIEAVALEFAREQADKCIEHLKEQKILEAKLVAAKAELTRRGLTS